jgi:hypothetical protein
MNGSEEVGAMVRERWVVVAEINKVCVSFLVLSTRLNLCFIVLQTLHTLLEAFYEQLSLSTSQQPLKAAATESMLMNTSVMNYTAYNLSRGDAKGMRVGEVSRHVERLLLRLDFNGGLSKLRARGMTAHGTGVDLLAEGGLA